jgi:hypothetical protein
MDGRTEGWMVQEFRAKGREADFHTEAGVRDSNDNDSLKEGMAYVIGQAAKYISDAEAGAEIRRRKDYGRKY